MIYESYFKPFIHIIYYYCTITIVYNKLFSPAVANVIRINISVTLDSITYCQVVCRWRKSFIVRKIIILPTRTTRNWLYFCTSEFSRSLSVSPTNRKHCAQYNIIQVWYSVYNVHILYSERGEQRLLGDKGETLQNCSSRVVSTTCCTSRVLWSRRVEKKSLLLRIMKRLV